MRGTEEIFELFNLSDKLSVVITDLRGNVLIESLCDFPVRSLHNGSEQFVKEFGKLPVITITFDGYSNMSMEFPVASMEADEHKLSLTGPKGVATFNFLNRDKESF